MSAAAAEPQLVPTAPTQSRWKSLLRPLRRVWKAYYKGASALAAYSSRFLGWAGGFTARRPVLVVLLALLVAILCSLGWLRIHTEDAADVLWWVASAPPGFRGSGPCSCRCTLSSCWASLGAPAYVHGRCVWPIAGTRLRSTFPLPPVKGSGTAPRLPGPGVTTTFPAPSCGT